MNRKIYSSFLLVIVLLSAMGCKKWRENRDTLTSEDHTLAEASCNDILRNVLVLTSPVGQLLIGQDTCLSVQTGGSTFPQSITLNFGSGDCTGLFQDQTEGQIQIVLSDSFHHSGATAFITLQNYYSKGYGVTGTIRVENTGPNTNGNEQFEVVIEDIIITAEEDRVGEDFEIRWSSTYVHELIERNNATFMLDDLYQITGQASGINQEGRSFTATITEPLTKYLNCRWPGKGTTNVEPSDMRERDLEYGECRQDPCCDNIAVEIVRFTDQTVRMK